MSSDVDTFSAANADYTAHSVPLNLPRCSNVDASPDTTVPVPSAQEPSTRTSQQSGSIHRLANLMNKWKNSSFIETTGITPIPVELRTEKRMHELAFIMFSITVVIGNFSVGLLGPVFYNLSFQNSVIILVLVDIVSSVPSAYTIVFGPKLGMRAMVLARFTWGYYGGILPSILNVLAMMAYLIINVIIGGQLLAKVSGHLNVAVGIVIISIISLVVSLLGYRVLHWYERIAWIPLVVTYIVMLAVGRKHFDVSAAPLAPATFATIMSFVGLDCAGQLAWGTMLPDFGVYHDPSISSLKTFAYGYIGMVGGNIITHILGALFGASVFNTPAWHDGLGPDLSDVGGLLSAVLAPARNGGKLLLVLVALSTPSICAPTMYTFGTSLMTISPLFAKVPRLLFSVLATVILIPLAIVGSSKFFSTVTVLINILGYWASIFLGTVLVEHFLFRSGKFSESDYSVQDWNNSTLKRQRTPTRTQYPDDKMESPTVSSISTCSSSAGLPSGLAAVLTLLLTLALTIPCMQLPFFVGPIAMKGTGDIGTLVAFFSSGIIYAGVRSLERRLFS